MRYYFNVRDGQTILDDEGLEFNDIEDVKEEAFRAAPEMIKGLTDHLWNGEPWVLWVSDQPKGGGNTVLTLTFMTRMAA